MSDSLEFALQLCMLISVTVGILILDLNRTVHQTVALPVVAVQNALEARSTKKRRESCC